MDGPGGQSPVASTRFFIDSIAPVTSLQVGEPKAGSEPTYVASTTAFGLQSSSPPKPSTRSMPEGFVLFASSFTIASEGAHELTYYSEDPTAIGKPFGPLRSSRTPRPPSPRCWSMANRSPGPVWWRSRPTLRLRDRGRGLRDRRDSVLPGRRDRQVFASTFSLSAGTRELRFFALDRLGNREAARLVTVEVSGPDTQAPDGQLRLWPRLDDHGFVSHAERFLLRRLGVDPASVRFFLDSVDVTSQAVVTASSASLSPLRRG